jgi:hypothetical protein
MQRLPRPCLGDARRHGGAAHPQAQQTDRLGHNVSGMGPHDAVIFLALALARLVPRDKAGKLDCVRTIVEQPASQKRFLNREGRPQVLLSRPSPRAHAPPRGTRQQIGRGRLKKGWNRENAIFVDVCPLEHTLERSFPRLSGDREIPCRDGAHGISRERVSFYWAMSTVQLPRSRGHPGSRSCALDGTAWHRPAYRVQSNSRAT